VVVLGHVRWSWGGAGHLSLLVGADGLPLVGLLSPFIGAGGGPCPPFIGCGSGRSSPFVGGGCGPLLTFIDAGCGPRV
jgi:hypothetical protein